MKINGERFDSLQKALLDTLKVNGLHPFMVQNERHAWEVFHRAVHDGRIVLTDFYNDCTDEHISTAMRKIFKN